MYYFFLLDLLKKDNDKISNILNSSKGSLKKKFEICHQPVGGGFRHHFRPFETMFFLGPIGPLELGLSVGLLEVFIENLLNLHWGPLDDSRMGNGEWEIGNGEWGLGIGD